MNAKIILLASTLFSPVLSADTLFVSSSSGTDTGSCTDSSSPCATLQYTLSKANSGDEIRLLPGVYSGNKNSLNTYEGKADIPNGTSSAYTRIVADQNFTVEISSEFGLSVNSKYLYFEGIRFTNTTTSKNVSGHHIKIKNSAFVGGPSKGNEAVFGIGTNDANPGAHHILLEDVWSYGKGGRYNILIYNSQDVIVRRAVIRHDGGWQYDGSNPEAGINIYNSGRVQLQNVIVLDSISDNGNKSFEAVFYNVKNDSSPIKHENTRIVGSIALNNSKGTSFSYEGGGVITSAVLENSAAVGYKSGISGNSNNITVDIKNLTLAKGTGDAFAEYSSKVHLNVSNSIIVEHSGEIFRDINNQNNNDCEQDCDLSYPPYGNGLQYITRIEEGSTLATAGQPSGQVGAKILNATGLNDTYYGEAGFDQEQDSLWPWPNEAVIMNDLCTIRNDGLCDGSVSSLTEYVWESLGNEMPTNLQSMPRPQNVLIQKKTQ